MTKRAGISGVGFYVPPKVVTNRDLEKMVETTDEWIQSRTGISERRIAEKGTGSSDLGKEASLIAIKNAGISAEDIDLIITATSTPDMPLPSTACIMQEKLGAKNAAAFDLAAACSGFVYGLVTAEQFVLSGKYKNVLVVGVDLISSYIDWTDRGTCILFGDGAGAAVVTTAKSGGILSSVLGSDGKYADLLKIACGGSRAPASPETVGSKGHFLQMNGQEVFKLAVRGMADATESALKQAGVEAKDVVCFIPHQANLRIIDAVADRLNYPKEKIFINLQKYGNTSAAACAIALCEALEAQKFKKGDKIVLATFGAGLVWGAMVIEW